jgi:subtilisin family serine protease
MATVAPSPAAGAESRNAGESSRPAGSGRLKQKAERDGFVRVIASLRSDFVPEGRLGRAAVRDQRAEIDRAQADLRHDLTGTGYRVVREFKFVPAMALALSPRALEAARRSPQVEGLAEDRPLEPVLDDSVPIVEGTTIWNAGHTGSGKTVAVLDTGVAKNHSFLSGSVVEEACFSARSDCPTGDTTQIGTGAGVPCTYAADGCRHGTHVAGIAAGEGPSFSGVARDANVMAVQVFSRFNDFNCGAGERPCALSFTTDQIAGLERVFDVRNEHDFASVNISIGGGQFASTCDTTNPTHTAYKAAIDNLRTAGIATVIASGNNGFTNSAAFPACISSAVTVGSTTKGDNISSFSNSASYVDVLAPGSNITSSVPGGSFDVFSGTSMAAPHLAGAWALLEQENPAASVSDIQTSLQNTGVPVADTRSGGTHTKPRICLAAAAGITNDDFADSDVIPGSTVTITGSNGCATTETGEPDHAGSSPSKSVWYHWTAPADGSTTIDTAGSNFDTLLGVYTGNAVNALTDITSNDDAAGLGTKSRVSFAATSGTVYRIAVDGFDGDMAGITLNLAGPAGANNPPIAVDDSITTNQDVASAPRDVLANDTDADGDALEITESTNGAHGTVSCDAGGSCTYTPQPDFNGTDSFTYTVSDGNGGSDTATAGVRVINQAPTAVDDSLTTDEDVQNSVDVLTDGVDTDPEGDALSVTGNTNGSNGDVTCEAGGLCTYTPDANFHGGDSFDYTVSDDNGGTDVGTVDVTIDSMTDNVSRTVTLDLRRHLKASGKVNAPASLSNCEDRVPVKIQRKKSGQWNTVKSATTTRSGAFDTNVPDRRGTYRSLAPAVQAGGDNCRRDTSPTERHRHRR